MSEEVVIGTDINDVLADMNPRPVEFEYNGKVWQFKVRELTWSERNALITKAGRGKDGIDMGSLNMLYMEKSVVESPFPINKANMLRVSGEFGDLMTRNIIGSGDEITEEEEGN